MTTQIDCFDDLIDDLENFYGFEYCFNLAVSCHPDEYRNTLLVQAGIDRLTVKFVNFLFIVNGF